jgi:hypothetical protein
MSHSSRFYQQLPLYPDFTGLTEPTCYRDLPSDWLLVVSDVEGSTQAIQAGRYKEVNALGASVIIAVLNIVKPLSIPFIFGGDGASLCIPPGYNHQIESALLAARQLAKDSYQLHLRVGIVPVQIILDAGLSVKVARYQVSANYTQAMLSGGGLSYAEDLLKDVEKGKAFRLETGKTSADFSGLECRWNNIPSRQGQSVALLVRAVSSNELLAAQIYRQVLDKIQLIYGEQQDCHPINIAFLKVTHNQQKLGVETAIHTFGSGWVKQLQYRLKLLIKVTLGQILMTLGAKLAGVDWGEYKADVIDNTDCRKFDDMLRMILSGNEQQRMTLYDYLEGQRVAGELYYGMQISNSSLITCLIFQRQGEHVHFVDGADGGYAIASTQLKQQIDAQRRS